MLRGISRRGAGAVIAIAVLAGTASAGQAMTISIGQPSLSARISIVVPLTVSCSPFDPALVVFDTNASVRIEQASGRGIARGSGEADGNVFSGPLLWACDGTSRTVPVSVLADP